MMTFWIFPSEYCGKAGCNSSNIRQQSMMKANNIEVVIIFVNYNLEG
jgi:hypothetical protein